MYKETELFIEIMKNYEENCKINCPFLLAKKTNCLKEYNKYSPKNKK